jgi:hypothetical protein
MSHASNEPTPARDPVRSAAPVERALTSQQALRADGAHASEPRPEDDADERISSWLHASLGFEVG